MAEIERILGSIELCFFTDNFPHTASHHDSTKGYSHGCIEIEQRFFNILRVYLKSKKNKRRLLKVKYTPGLKTEGGTLK